ncbi:MAG: hypothetical protein V5783_03040 [Pontiella sp.]
MSTTHPADPRRPQEADLQDAAPKTASNGTKAVQHTRITLGGVQRLTLAARPHSDGTLVEQIQQTLAGMNQAIAEQPLAMTVTSQTLFVRCVADIAAVQHELDACYGDRMPATTFVVQAPLSGKALAIEAWAIGGDAVKIDFPRAGTVTVEYDGLRWIYIGGITAPADSTSAYDETQSIFKDMVHALELEGAGFNDVTRIWLYQAGITELEMERVEGLERYRELNRSRADFFDRLEDAAGMPVCSRGRTLFPPSTGIGMTEGNLTASCTALQTSRKEVRLIPLENPNQTAAFDYARRFSAKSPKFSRAMAMVSADYTTTWVSGTASILDSESVHLDDIEKQTEQTIDNIEALIGPENLSRHGAEGAGAQLSDLVRVRIYVKHKEDYAKCRAVCERRLGSIPAIYVFADVCRSELLVEIEGISLSNITSER